MRAPLGWLGVVIVLLAAWALPRAQAAIGDTEADRVFGQPDFSHATGGIGPKSLGEPADMAVDANGNLFVADTDHHRVLEYKPPLLTEDQAAAAVFGQPDLNHGMPNAGGSTNDHGLYYPEGVALDAQGDLYVADRSNNRVLVFDVPMTGAASLVIGQPNFGSSTMNSGGLSERSLNAPNSVAVDTHGNLYVADAGNNRVLEYDAPLSTHMAASRVFGQPNFMTNTANTGGLNASSLYIPYGVGLDGQNNLYVADSFNNRVLEYDAPLSSHMPANRVIGQPNFMTNTLNTGGLSATSLNEPSDVAVDTHGNLYVGDGMTAGNGNNRVLEYDAPLSTGMAAHRVFGQPNFNSNLANNGGLSAHTLFGDEGVAVDAHNNLYVADSFNNRVLEYDQPVLPRRLYLPLLRR